MISIIVPVYNAEKFLCRCIDSIISQSFKDWELLLINDGSIDSSGAICDQYATKDNRIRVIHKVNAGVSNARNFGLLSASGEWVTFCDSDDELLPESLSNYAKTFSDDIDVVRGGFERVKNGVKTTITTADKITDDKELVICTCNKTRYEAYLWNSCFRRSAIGNITFNENLSFCEDHLFTYSVMAKARKVAFISDLTYRYYAPDTSAIGSAANLSSRYLEPSMILEGAKLERDVKMSCLSETAFKGRDVVQEEFEWKVRHALKYATIARRYKEAFLIYMNFKECKLSDLITCILDFGVKPAIRNIINMSK